MGKNARSRKEKKIIDKYGELPQPPKPFPWGKAVAGLLILVLLGLGIRDLVKHGKQYAQNIRVHKPHVSLTTAKKVAATPTFQPKIEPTAALTADEENKRMTATISTTMGDITIELYPKDAPKTVENFKELANEGYYNGIIFHRVIKGFMNQTGDPTGTGRGGQSIYGHAFDDEINSHKIVDGTVAMANAGPNTNGSQFFIMSNGDQDYSYLDGHYTVFGQVTSGMDVVRKINAVATDSNDKPLQDVKMTKVTFEEK